MFTVNFFFFFFQILGVHSFLMCSFILGLLYVEKVASYHLKSLSSSLPPTLLPMFVYGDRIGCVHDFMRLFAIGVAETLELNN